jgi:exodeoxyribonuclease VII large subunit
MVAKITVAPPAGAPAATNAPELTVSELANALKRTVEDRFGHVRVRGEISNYRGPHSSGHAYFSLKDAGARLDAVIWKTAFAKLKTRPEEGLEVIAVGRITTYPGKSAYQIVIDSMEPAGVGALMALLEDRRKRLLAEGLFEASAKKPLPYLPTVIGVVTSPTGAVIRDILHRLRERFPRHVLVWPVRVQGDTAAAEVAAAIAGFNMFGPGGIAARPDVLIVARGGGSLEDLWAFNEEIVVRAVAASAIPVISAVGHETDTTLIDFVADLRTPTPTGAAEKSVPVRVDLIAQIADFERRRAGATRRGLDRTRSMLDNVARVLSARDRILELPRQRTDRNAERLDAAMRRMASTQRQRLARAAQALALHTPIAEFRKQTERALSLQRHFDRIAAERIVQRRRDQVETLGARLRTARNARTAPAIRDGRRAILVSQSRLRQALARAVAIRRADLDRESKLLASLGYMNVLARGFALVRAGLDGPPVKHASDVKPGIALDIQFADGSVAARAEGAKRPRRTAPERGGGGGQGSLF